MDETTATAIGLVAGAFAFAAYWIYNQDDGKINTGTWIIFAICDLLDLGSYVVMTDGWAMSIAPAALSLGSAITCFLAFAKGRFSWPDRVEWVVLGLNILITALWWLLATGRLSFPFIQLSPAAIANIAYQASALLAVGILYRGLITRKERENPLPWALWSVSYILFFVVAAYGHKIEEMVYPMVGSITHFGVLAIVSGVGKKRAPQ